MKYLPNSPDAVPAEHSDSGSDFKTSSEERSLPPLPKAHWWLPVTGIVFIVLLLLFVLNAKGG